MECCGGLKVKAMLKNNAVKSERRFLSMVGRYVDEYLHNLSKAASIQLIIAKENRFPGVPIIAV